MFSCEFARATARREIKSNPGLLSKDEAVEAVNTQGPVVEGMEDIPVVELENISLFRTVPVPSISEENFTLGRGVRNYRSAPPDAWLNKIGTFL